MNDKKIKKILCKKCKPKEISPFIGSRKIAYDKHIKMIIKENQQ